MRSHSNTLSQAFGWSLIFDWLKACKHIWLAERQVDPVTVLSIIVLSRINNLANMYEIISK